MPTPITPQLQQPPAAGGGALRFGRFTLDRAGARLLRDGQVVELAPRPFALLCCLADRPGRLVSKDELLDRVWGHRHVSDSALKVCINALRQALGDDARQPQWLHTVSRRGYRFDLAPLPTSLPATLTQGPDDPAPAGRARHAGAGAGAPAQPAPDAAPACPSAGNLPLPTGALCGRDDDLATLLLTLAQHRLVTLVGPGGVGKTRLALAAARLQAAADGCWLLRLDDLTSADAVGPALARTLGLAEGAGRSPAALAQALAPLALWLLLDNAEHIVEALAPQIALWLQQAPGLSMLVTSQRPLRLQAEVVLPLAPLATPAVHAEAPAVRSSPAVALLVQRVQMLRPDWVPAEADWPELAAVARALDGLPLALELAAARVPLLGAAGVRQRLGARLQMLTGGAADAPLRHRTLRASLDWSVGLLPPDAERALAWLSVFVGGFTAGAAQAVLARALPGADEWTLLDTLQALQDAALLDSTQPSAGRAGTAAAAGPSGLGAAGDAAGCAPEAPPVEPRLRLLDSVRLHGLERLALADEGLPAQAAHRAWALARWRAADRHDLQGGTERWLLPLQPELQNLTAAMERGLDRLQALSTSAGSPAEAALLARELAELVALATGFGLRSGLAAQLKAWRDRLQPWVAAAGSGWPALLRGQWCLGGAMLGGPGTLGTQEALALGEQAVALLDERPERRQLALYVSGVFQLRLGLHDALAATLAQMQAWSGEAAAAPSVRRLRPMLQALWAQARGDLPAYLAFWTGALAEARALGERFEAWRAAWGVGQALVLQGRSDEAVAVMDEALDEVRRAGQLQAQAGFASQAVLVRLSRDASPATLQRLLEVLPVLQGQGTVFAALGDALAWVPLWLGHTDDALRIQAWADARIATENMQRAPVARRVREAFAQATQDARPPDAPPLDEAAVLALVGALARQALLRSG